MLKPSCGSSAPPDKSPALFLAASSDARPAASLFCKLRASVPRNVPGASNTLKVFSSAPDTNVVDPAATVFAVVLESCISPVPGGGSVATQVTWWPWICGRAISRHPAGAGSASFSRSSSSSSSSTLSQLACIRAVKSLDPETTNRPDWSQDKQVTSPAWPALAAVGTQRSDPLSPARRQA